MVPTNGMYCITGEKFEDPEWEAAMATDEKEYYYRCEVRYGVRQYGLIIKKYKPAIMELMAKRTSSKFVKIG